LVYVFGNLYPTFSDFYFENVSRNYPETKTNRKRYLEFFEKDVIGNDYELLGNMYMKCRVGVSSWCKKLNKKE